MGPGAAYAHIAMSQAIADAGLSEDQVVNVNPRTGFGGGLRWSIHLAPCSTAHQTVAEDRRDKADRAICRAKMHERRPFRRTSSTAFKIKGINYSITSACSTSLHCIGVAMPQSRS